jgi:hypothetical protein
MSWLFLRGNYRFKKNKPPGKKTISRATPFGLRFGGGRMPRLENNSTCSNVAKFQVWKSMGAKNLLIHPEATWTRKTPHPWTLHTTSAFHVALSRKEPVSQGISYKPSRMPAISATNRRQKHHLRGLHNRKVGSCSSVENCSWILRFHHF